MARSCSNSFNVAFIRLRLNSSIARSFTISYSPAEQVTGKP